MCGRDMLRRVACGSAAGLVALAVAGCDQAQAPTPTVIVNTPPADTGSWVLVTALIGVAFVLGAVAVVCAWGWCAERRARREAETARRVAEDVAVALTGHPADGLGLLATRAAGLWPVRRELAADRSSADRTGREGAGADQ